MEASISEVETQRVHRSRILKWSGTRSSDQARDAAEEGPLPGIITSRHRQSCLNMATSTVLHSFTERGAEVMQVVPDMNLWSNS